MSVVLAEPGLPPGSSLRQDARTIGLVGLAHATSHAFHLLLPPLFPAFSREFGLGYAELGLLMTVFFTISGIGQALAGFVVDRFGARPALLAALGCFVAAALAASLAEGYGGLVLAALLAGLGNAPFHPADFTILNRRVSPARIGHAYSVHGITGNLGWAAAPLFILGVSEVSGSWRVACGGMALVAAAVMLVLLAQREAIDDRMLRGRLPPGAEAGAPAAPVSARPPEHPMAFLKLPEIWLCFSFFVFSTAALAAVQSFAGPALARLYGLPPAVTGLVVTVYMIVASVAMLAGGFLASRVRHVERTVGLMFAMSAALLVMAGSGWLPGLAALACVALAGAGTGLAGPSRDLMIKRATPPGATGRVYGTVYCGLDVGFALGAPAFGWFMDHGWPGAVFHGAAAVLLMAVLSAVLIGPQVQRSLASRGG